MINNNNNNNNNNNRVNTSHKSEVNILWNQQVRNDRTVPNNKQDIIIHDNEIGICMLIDVAIPGDRNVIKKEAEKIFKCKDLLIEINRTWNMKAKLIPVINRHRQYLKNISGKHEIKDIQKTAILGAAHILRKVLM